MWPETPRVWLEVGPPARGGSPRVAWIQVIMMGKEILDLAMTQFPHLQSGNHARASGDIMEPVMKWQDAALCFPLRCWQTEQ